MARAEMRPGRERLIEEANRMGDNESGAKPPATVREAFERARATLGDRLLFGEDCERGVIGLAEDAGPPEKILNYLRTLAKAAERRRSGTLGKSVTQWLRDEGLQVSRESETVANSAAEKMKRTWHDGDGYRCFNKHLKPTAATARNRCVRIYFEWNEARDRYAVGWIGIHP